jgi:hypothetical protein
MDRKLLTPAEAALLLVPSSSTATACVQAGLLSLLGAGRINFERASSLFQQCSIHLNSSAATAAPLPRHLAVLEQALGGYGKGDRLLSSEVLHALQKRFGVGFGGYLRDEVAVGLIERGLLTRTDGKWLGLLPRVTYQRTSRGDAVIAPVQRLIGATDELKSLLASNPDEAIRLARSAGVLLVMSPKARRQVPKLRKLFDQRREDVTTMASFSIGGDRASDSDDAFELGDLGLALESVVLFESLDIVGDFTSGGDSSSSDGGDGGGGGGD